MGFHVAHIHDYDRFIALDVGFYRVRASLCEMRHGEMVHGSFSNIRQLRKNVSEGQIVDMRGVADILDRAIIQSSQKCNTIPDDIILSFSSSSFIFDSITTQYIRGDVHSPIRMEEIDMMIKKIESESFIRAKKKGKLQLGIAYDDIRLISSTITAIQIDGKYIQNPLGFSGSKIRLTILNIFVPATEFNVVRSIVASLDKRVISIIPSPLVLPKIIEYSDYVEDAVCIIDVGYMHTTILLQSNNQILAFETFPIGSERLMQMLLAIYEGYTPIQIENMLYGIPDNEMSGVVGDFLMYISDIVFTFFTIHESLGDFRKIFCYGGIFQNKYIYEQFSNILNMTPGREISVKRIIDILPENIPHEGALTYGLSYMASELLHVKKDPLIRILRYILYNYE